LETIVVDRTEGSLEKEQHLCLEKGYDHPLGQEVITQTNYRPHPTDQGGKTCYPKSKDIDPRRQTKTELFGINLTGMCTVLVPTAGSVMYFEIIFRENTDVTTKLDVSIVTDG